MSHRFTWAERYGVFTAHGSAQGTKCWLCRNLLSLSDMEIDHVLPESLLHNATQLSVVLRGVRPSLRSQPEFV